MASISSSYDHDTTRETASGEPIWEKDSARKTCNDCNLEFTIYVEGGITVDAVVACSVKNVVVKNLNWHSMFRHLVLWKTTKMKD